MSEKKPIQLVTKILEIMEHYVSTTLGFSKGFCGGRRTTLAGIGQGNGFGEHVQRIVVNNVERNKEITFRCVYQMT